MTTTTETRPFEKIATATLLAVVKRGKYSRFGQEFEAALDAELLARRYTRSN